jgi:hypothetical protein
MQETKLSILVNNNNRVKVLNIINFVYSVGYNINILIR